MNTDLQAAVLIVGAGPVGLCLAIDLARRGTQCLVLERRPAGEPPSVKCNHVSSRTMETLRRLGFVDRVRSLGLPDDYPNDVVVRTTATGFELTRIHDDLRQKHKSPDAAGVRGLESTRERWCELPCPFLTKEPRTDKRRGRVLRVPP